MKRLIFALLALALAACLMDADPPKAYRIDVICDRMICGPDSVLPDGRIRRVCIPDSTCIVITPKPEKLCLDTLHPYGVPGEPLPPQRLRVRPCPGAGE